MMILVHLVLSFIFYTSAHKDSKLNTLRMVGINQEVRVMRSFVGSLPQLQCNTSVNGADLSATSLSLSLRVSAAPEALRLA